MCDHRGVNHATRARAVEGIARLSKAELDLATLFVEMNRLVARALPSDGACWHTVDPATLVETGYFVQDMPPPDAHVAKFAYLSGDFNSLIKLARGPRHSGVLSAATGGQLERSLRYRELLAPKDIQGELRASLVVEGQAWGCFSLFRMAPADFTEVDQDFAHDLSSLLGRGLRAAGIRARTTGHPVTLWPGLVLLDENLRVESVTEPARTWLEELGHLGMSGRDALPFALLAAAERARGPEGSASARALGVSGRWVQVHASPMAGAPKRIAVILQAAPSPSLAPLISATYGLTARERELTELVLQGCGTHEIAERLFISPHTVQAHLKSIFAKTGVHSRRELVGRVFAP